MSFSKATNKQLRELIAERWDGTLAHVSLKAEAKNELAARTAWLKG